MMKEDGYVENGLKNNISLIYIIDKFHFNYHLKLLSSFCKKEVSVKSREVSETLMHIVLNNSKQQGNGITVRIQQSFSFHRNNQSSSSASSLVLHNGVVL